MRALAERPTRFVLVASPDWPLQEGEGVSLHEDAEVGWQQCCSVDLVAKVDSGERLIAEGRMHPSYIHNISPPREPCQAPSRFGFMFTPQTPEVDPRQISFFHHISTRTHMGSTKKGAWRRPKVHERELIMGFPLDYTKHCVVKSEQTGVAYDDARAFPCLATPARWELWPC